jgi:hypothetical protein
VISDAHAINELGQIAMDLQTDATSFATPATTVNNRGEVIVCSMFRWSAEDGLMVLPDLIDPADPLVGRVQFAGSAVINNGGEIAITGQLDDAPARERGVLLEPDFRAGRSRGGSAFGLRCLHMRDNVYYVKY